VLVVALALVREREQVQGRLLDVVLVVLLDVLLVVLLLCD